MDLIITDLDDTLWKWCKTWHAGFAAFNEVLVGEGIPLAAAEEAWAHMYEREKGAHIEFPPDARDIAQVCGIDVSAAETIYAKALTESRSSRDSAMEAFDGVVDTFAALRERDALVVAHTDAPVTAAIRRLHTLGLDGAVDALYARPSTYAFGDPVDLSNTRVVNAVRWESKPSTVVLAEITETYGVDPSRTLYVGDSKRRDMAMATAAGCVPVWAAYGVDYPEREPAIEALVKVQSRVPFPPDPQRSQEPNAVGHAHVEKFSDLLDILDSGV